MSVLLDMTYINNEIRQIVRNKGLKLEEKQKIIRSVFEHVLNHLLEMQESTKFLMNVKVKSAYKVVLKMQQYWLIQVEKSYESEKY
ncbi:MAG: hypothetical protein ACTSWR_00770 [Candidatus Helarchaeota archaeon]